MRLTAILFALLATAFATNALAQSSAGSPQSETGTEREIVAPSASDPLRALRDVLADDAARSRLLEALSQTNQEVGAPQAATETTPPQATTNETTATETTTQPAEPAAALAEDFAQSTTRLAEQAGAIAGRFAGSLAGLIEVVQLHKIFTDDAVLFDVMALVLTIVSTIALHRGLSHLARPLYRWLGALRGKIKIRWLRSAGLQVGAALISVLVVVAAYGVGHALALVLSGDLGVMAPSQALYLNAFLVVGLCRAAALVFLAPRYPELRLVPMSDAVAAFTEMRASAVIRLLGYGLMAAVPFIAADISLELARALRTALMLLAAGVAISTIWAIKGRVDDEFEDRREDAPAAPGEKDFTARLLRLAGVLWPMMLTGYVLALLIVAVARPIRTLPFLLEATALSLFWAALGVVVVTFLTKAMRGRMLLPKRFHGELPQLEARLSALTPKVISAARFVTLLLVTGAVADAWGVIDFGGWLAEGSGAGVVAAFANAAVIVLVGLAVWLGFGAYVEHRLSDRLGRAPSARERTLLPLLASGLGIIVAISAGMIALSELGINIAPLLAGAGVVGLAVGFGAQTLVRDIITGIFIQLENALHEGDVVTVAGVTGTVEKLSLRCVNIRDLSGTLHVTPFSEVTTVSNFMRGYAYHVAEIGVAYKEDVESAKAAMRRAFEKLRDDDVDGAVISDLEMHGVIALGDSAVVIRARIKTRPGSQWAVGRRYTECVKEIFDAEGIEIPFPHITLLSGVDKSGQTLLAMDGPSAAEGASALERDEMERSEETRPTAQKKRTAAEAA